MDFFRTGRPVAGLDGFIFRTAQAGWIFFARAGPRPAWMDFFRTGRPEAWMDFFRNVRNLNFAQTWEPCLRPVVSRVVRLSSHTRRDQVPHAQESPARRVH